MEDNNNVPSFDDPNLVELETPSFDDPNLVDESETIAQTEQAVASSYNPQDDISNQDTASLMEQLKNLGSKAYEGAMDFGTTMNAAVMPLQDEIAGAVGVAKNLPEIFKASDAQPIESYDPNKDLEVGGNYLENLMSTYKQYRDSARQEVDTAKERSPIASTAGSVVGTAGLAGLLGGVNTASQAIPTGAALGAAESEAELGSDRFLTDTAIGAGLGALPAVASKVKETVVPAAKEAIERTALATFGSSTKGAAKKLGLDVDTKKKLGRFILDNDLFAKEPDEVASTISQLMNETGAQLDDIYDAAKASDVTIPSKYVDALFKQKTAGKISDSARKEVSEELLNPVFDVATPDQLAKNTQLALEGSPLYSEALPQASMIDLGPKELRTLQQKVGDQAFHKGKDVAKSEVAGAFTDAYGSVKDAQKVLMEKTGLPTDKLSELEKLNKEFSDLYSLKAINQENKFVKDAGGASGLFGKMKDFAQETVGNKVISGSDKALAAYSKGKAPISTLTEVGGIKGATAIGSDAKDNRSESLRYQESMSKMRPSEIKELQDYISTQEGGSSFVNVLEKLNNTTDERTKAALQYGLVSQPAFRHLIKDKVK